MKILTIETKKRRDVVDITNLVDDALARNSVKGELCYLFIRHTTAAITTALIDREQELDLIGTIETVIAHPAHVRDGEHLHTHHKTYLPPDICAAFVGTTLTVPVKDGKLYLGKFQRVVLLEFEGPGTREVIVTGV